MNNDKLLVHLKAILPYYSCSAENSTITQLGNGLINDTFLVDSKHQRFVLQRINTHAFPEPALITNNAELIHLHLQTKINENIYDLASIGHIKNINGDVLTHLDNQYWRAIDYIDNTLTIDAIDNTQQAAEVAKAFAKFTATLHDFDATKLTDTIQNFHHINSRLNQLEYALLTAQPARKKLAEELVLFVEEHMDFVGTINEASLNLPKRVTHNDTKINNLLYSTQTNTPVAVIDLDTCMAGFLMNDFGDLARTCCPNIDENSIDINTMRIRTDVFKIIAQEYITAFKGNISNNEKESLVLGAQLLPFMLGIRFLTDFLNGDLYFHTQYKNHNLDRTKNQFKLFSLFLEKNAELLDIVKKIR